MAGMRRRGAYRRDLAWALFFLGLFGYVLCLTSQRIELKAHNGRIKELESALQRARNDEAILRVTIERECSYAEIRKRARDRWGMDVARRDQRILLAAGEGLFDAPAAPATAEKAGLISLAGRLGHVFREGVAQARPARTAEGGDGSPAR